jgi:hypothetical protein
MIMKYNIVAYASSDYQCFIPLFKYCARRAYPKDNVHITIVFASGCSSAAERFIYTPPNYQEYNYIYITDIDMLMFPKRPGLLEYFSVEIERCRQNYAGMRGPLQTACPFEGGWTGNHSRMAGGSFMVTPKWYTLTQEARLYHSKLLKKTGYQYREQDEVVLYDICSRSGLKTPEMPGFFASGTRYNKAYRGVHLGDFKFEHRYLDTQRMMANFLFDENVRNWLALERESGWKDVLREVWHDNNIQMLVKNCREHIKQRI